jgi:hypothetical protein
MFAQVVAPVPQVTVVFPLSFAKMLIGRKLNYINNSVF